MKLTRREWAGALTTSLAAAPQAAPAQESATQLLEQEVAQTRRDSAAIAKLELPAATEPSFVFRPL